jgi:hypothetical protein
MIGLHQASTTLSLEPAGHGTALDMELSLKATKGAAIFLSRDGGLED